MSYPADKALTNYGVQIARGYYGRRFYSDESTTNLTVIHDNNRAIDVITTGTHGSITIGHSTANKNVVIHEGTLTGQYASISTLTDGVATLNKGTLSETHWFSLKIPLLTCY